MPSLKELWELNEDGPDPTMSKCIRCKGKGYYANGGFTKNASRNMGECYLCKGRQEYPSNYYVKCLKCKGFGFWHVNGRGQPWQTVKPCTNCEGAGYQKLEDPDNELRPIECLMCKGRGQYHYKGWCHQGLEKFIKGDCPCCEGKGVLLGNFSRCKRCKGKGAFSKTGVISQFQNPVYIDRECEDCEGKGFLKEEEPVEDDSESVETDEDSQMKNQPEDDDDYAGLQPEEDPDYYAGSENESSSSSESDPTPEGIESECNMCGGLGHYHSSGWSSNEKTKKGDCPLCKGEKVYNKNWYYECIKCHGKGNFNEWNGAKGCSIWTKSGEKCSCCDGVGYNKIDFYTKLKPQECLMCKGKGHYGNPGYWVGQKSKTKRGDCPCCEGKGELYGNWEECNNCKGKGGMKGKKTPVSVSSKSKERDCEECDGKGHIPSNDETKEYLENGPGPKKKEKKSKKEDSKSKSEDSKSEKKSSKKKKKPKKVKSDSNSKKDEKEEEKEEEKVEEKEPEPDDGVRTCARCNGQGHYNKFGWCGQGASNKLGDCPLCEGKGKYEKALFRKCKKCTGLGAHNVWRPCDIWSSHWSVQPCSSCNKVGYLSSRPESQLKAKTCPLCDGYGHYNKHGWNVQQKREGGQCPLCNGKAEIYGKYEKCVKCKGYGNFNEYGECYVHKDNVTSQCTECKGQGYTRSEELDKLEQEEFEKYGYNNKCLWELEPMPEKPEGADECCIIL